MTYEFEYMMHLFSCGALGNPPLPPRQEVDFAQVLELAQDHSVLPLVGAAISKSPDLGLPGDMVTSLVQITRGSALTNYMRRRQVLKLLEAFEAAGIQAILLKGYAISDLYAEPDFRISCDTDIYVKMEDETKALMLLSDHGCSVTPRTPISHHALCEHPQMGHIELHVLLHDEIVEDVWFSKMKDQDLVQEAYEKWSTPEGSYLALGRTDHLIFLTLHMIKHFILSGISLRQMTDIGLYIKNYRSQIDQARFWAILDRLKYRQLMNTIFSILVSYCGFTPDMLMGYQSADAASVAALLEDLETGGWLGQNEEEERKDAWLSYNRAKFTEKQNTFSYWGYMAKRKAAVYLPAIFPPRAVLSNQYPFAGKAALLVPVAWIRYIFSRLVKKAAGSHDAPPIEPPGQNPADKDDRVQLFKLMRMM